MNQDVSSFGYQDGYEHNHQMKLFLGSIQLCCDFDMLLNYDRLQFLKYMFGYDQEDCPRRKNRAFEATIKPDSQV
jgi:hypothetical protein